ncbi:thiamine-phosphate diphosphorylase [Seonamhaeicola sp. S2-3]|uniref:thiamine phosphate synthase n=1 Tax=Seonamhaeicola sp. S2-3 TaxID=1936081 RepID=UPI000972A091|nr:thiamine phosphate synthase [Seonamhaeicola sp. S2-3]APY10667.1 thiamine-phosphate diphosphorylase [Seonamhaeicola sp. S2-3]
MINKLHYISQGNTPKEHLENIRKACQYGAELVQLRLKNVSEKKILKTAEEARDITSHFQTRLIINDHYKIVEAVNADGVHLGKTDANPIIARKTLKSWQIIGGTANTLDDCQQRIKEKVDYIGLGPFRFTTTKKQLSPILGANGYLSIIDALNASIPIIAIGGITINDVPELLKTGIHGIAISGEITRDFNKIKALHTLLNAGSMQEQRYSFKN